jgi:predicted P-loop ATPase
MSPLPTREARRPHPNRLEPANRGWLDRSLCGATVSEPSSRVLFQAHVELLRVRGVSAEYAAAHGVSSVDLRAERAAREKYGGMPGYQATYPGLPLHNTTGVLVEYPDDQPQRPGAPYSRARADVREFVEQANEGMQSAADTTVTIPRWFACAGPVIPYIPPECRAVAADTSIAIGIAESPIKALSIQQNLGIPCIGLGGVTAGCHDAQARAQTGDIVAHPLLKRIDWRERTAFVFFDAGLANNPGVALGAAYAAVALRDLGAEVRFVRVPHVHPSETSPEDGDIYSATDQGPDDFIFRSGAPALHALIAAADPADPAARLGENLTKAEATCAGIDMLRQLDVLAMLYADPIARQAFVARIGSTRTVRAAVDGFRERLGRQQEEQLPEWRKELLMGQSGAVLGRIYNGLVILKNDTRLRGLFALDELGGAAVLTRAPPWDDHGYADQREVTDTDATRFHAWLEKEYGVSFGVKTIADMIDAAAEPFRFHPVRQWLDGLPPWDGKRRLHTWMSRYLGAPCNRWVMTVSRKTLLGMMARAYQPGCFVKTVPVLEGEQDDLKSTFVRSLIPNPSWWSDQLPADLADKDASQNLRGIWIMELPELVSKRRSDVDAVKAYISRIDDRYRPSYGRRTIRVARSIFFWGTTNDDEYASDTTGGSRWWPIQVGVRNAIDIDGFLAVRHQLYAEAIVAFRAGEHWWLDDDDDRALAAEEVELRRHPDPWETPMTQWLSHRYEATTYEALHALPRGRTDEPDDIKITRPDEMRMAQVFRALGWRKRRPGEGPERALGDDGRKHRVYIPGKKAAPRPAAPGGAVANGHALRIEMEDYL